MAFAPQTDPFKTSSKVYEALERLVTGAYCLIELAEITKQDLFTLTKSLAPYVRQGFIGFKEVPDLPPLKAVQSQSDTTSSEAIAPNHIASSSSSTLNKSPSSATSAPASGRSLDSIRVQLAQLDHLNHLAGELLIHQNQQASQQDETYRILQTLLRRLDLHQQTLNDIRDWTDQMVIRSHSGHLQSSLHQGHHDSISQTRTPTRTTALLPIEFDTLEMDRYSDLHLFAQTALDENANLTQQVEELAQMHRQSQRTLKHQQRLLMNMRDDLTNVRMRSVGDLFQRIVPVIQQLAMTYDKPIDIQLMGTNVLVDKAIAEKLYDPLLHLVRNAFDHGIESKEARRTQQKPEVGRITLCAYHQGNHTLIEVQDDGQGIQVHQVLQRAIAPS